MKNLFTTRTFWGAVFAFLAAASPATKAYAEKRITLVDYAEIMVTALAASGLTVVGRMGAVQRVYTPRGLPGEDPPTFAPETEQPQIEPPEY